MKGTQELALPDVLFHVTSQVAAVNIGLHGLPPDTAWVRSDIAAYHAQLLSQAGHAPLVLSLPINELEKHGAEPDWLSLQSPPAEVLEIHVETLNRRWTEGPPTWQRSVALVGSLRCPQPFPPNFLKAHLPVRLFQPR